MNRPDKGDVAARLKRIAGQIGGIQKMVEQDRYCVDIVMQVSAARAALAKVAKPRFSTSKKALHFGG